MNTEIEKLHTSFQNTVRKSRQYYPGELTSLLLPIKIIKEKIWRRPCIVKYALGRAQEMSEKLHATFVNRNFFICSLDSKKRNKRTIEIFSRQWKKRQFLKFFRKDSSRTMRFSIYKKVKLMKVINRSSSTEVQFYKVIYSENFENSDLLKVWSYFY